MRFAPGSGSSLSLRLLTFAGILIAIALIIAWLVLGVLFQRHLERQTQSELERHGLSLITATTLTPDQKLVLGEQPFDPRFNRPASGLYWRISSADQSLASRSLWDAQLERAANTPMSGWGVERVKGPYEPQVLVVSRDVQLAPDSAPVIFEVAVDLAAIGQSRQAFALETGLFLSILWLALAVAAWAQVRLGLRPLARIRDDLTKLNREPNARLVHDRQLKEIRPLVQAINNLLDARATDIERARRRSQDLAHALKTPLTALRLQIEDMPPAKSEKMLGSLSLIRMAVDAELTQNLGHDMGQSTRTTKLAERLWLVISRTPQASGIDFENQLLPDLKLPMADDRAMELLGALIENASRFARSTVRIQGHSDHTGLHLSIEDDGPGIPESQRETALHRGQRLDEKRGQHGLGLSIANQIIETSNGYLELGSSHLGGLEVRMFWPVGAN